MKSNENSNFLLYNNFQKYWLYFDINTFEKGIKRLIESKYNFFVFIYGKHDSNGISWCSDCVKSEPFVNNIKSTIMQRQSEKQIYFANISVEKGNKYIIQHNPYLKLTHVPTLIYFENGRETGRIVEDQISTQEMVNIFVDKAYK